MSRRNIGSIPLTVLKAYQQLVAEELVETRRGLGMFVNAGARDLLLKAERQKFLTERWPAIAATIQRLGITPKELWLPHGGQRSEPASGEAMKPASTISHNSADS